MSKDWNDIENLFNDASLGNNPSGDPVVPWSSIEKKVIRSNFFKYSVTTFNVYFLTIILGLASTIGYFTYSTLSKNAELKAKDEIIRKYQKKEIEEKIKSFDVDSINTLSDTLIGKNKKDKDSEVKINQPLSNMDGKKSVSNEAKQVNQAAILPDTISNVTVYKKVIKKQIIIKRTTRLRDSIVIN